MATMNVTQKGQIVIPQELREKYGIRPNSKVIVTEIDDHIAVLPVAEDPLKAGRGLLKFTRPVAEIIEQVHREERALEARRTNRFQGGRRGRRSRK